MLYFWQIAHCLCVSPWEPYISLGSGEKCLKTFIFPKWLTISGAEDSTVPSQSIHILKLLRYYVWIQTILPSKDTEENLTWDLEEQDICDQFGLPGSSSIQINVQ